MTNSHPLTDGSANRGIAGPFTLASLPIILVVAALGMSIDTRLAKAAFDLVIGENETISLLFALASPSPPVSPPAGPASTSAAAPAWPPGCTEASGSRSGWFSAPSESTPAC